MVLVHLMMSVILLDFFSIYSYFALTKQSVTISWPKGWDMPGLDVSSFEYYLEEESCFFA